MNNFKDIIDNYISNDLKFVKNNIIDDTTYLSKFEIIPLLVFTPVVTNALLKQIPKEEAVKNYIAKYQEEKHPSMLAKYEIINDYIRANTDIKIPYKIKECTFKLKNTQKLDSVTTQAHPSIVTILKMNRINPIICGYFFEYLLASIVTKNATNDLEISKICENTYLIDIQNLYLELSDNIEELDSYSVLSTKDFKTKYHFMLFKIFVDNRHKNDDYITLIDNILAVNAILTDRYISELDKYLSELKKCEFVHKLKHKNMKHSVDLEYSNEGIELIGESDFIGDDIILDCKCYKNESLDLWKYQLFYYKIMFNSDKIKECSIINLMNNVIYNFFEEVPEEVENIPFEIKAEDIEFS